jgi:ABC-type antimicrobial peptide transport system permease subunit
VEAYYLAGDADLPSMVVLLRTAGPPEGLVPFVASVAKSIDPKVFPDVQLVKSSFSRRMEGAEYAAISVSVLGFVALLLACLGIVGLVAYSVSHRTKEIGIRMALGASSAQVLSVVVRQLALPILAGSLAGVTGAAALSQLLRRELYGISYLDPIAYLGAIGVFVAMIGVAALLPARRALRVDPLRSLRYE